MERFLTDKILNWCIRISPLPESQKTIVRYGIELFLDNILKTTLIVAAGFLIGQGPQTILVLIAFSGLRSKAGGFHMQTSLGCTGAMLTVWVLSLAAGRWLSVPEAVLWSGFGAAVILLLLFAPAETKKHRFMSAQQKKKNKRAALAIACVLYLGAMFLLKGNARMLIILPVWLEVLSMLPCAEFPLGKDGRNKREKIFG
ncbi:accessory gene regulator ArgB-like protein [Murimonas intestini]|uniref:accessory gene regulator ArgB-like protein n=1 Tax=Murimonas intestini TaxID=1337051 RepID=UPI0011DD15BE|nr:accessory gene regulator B family protein [Murimonas intestini]